MADIKNKNELKRRIELFMDELDYSINKEYCMETMRMMREFIGHASHRLDCANSKIKSLMAKLREYQKLEEQGLLLRLPVAEGSAVYVTDYMFECKYNCECPLSYGKYKCEMDERCQHEYKKYFVREAKFNHMMLEKIGKTVFLTREEAEQALKQMGE